MRSVIVTPIFHKNYISTKTIIVNRGGARSSKSYSIQQLIVQKLTTEYNKKILVTRKTLPSLRVTAYKEICDLLKDYGYYQYCDHNKTGFTLTYLPTNSFIYFCSIDDPEKIKSTGWNYIWMEEATDFRYDDYSILKLRLSEPNDLQNHLYLSFNPIGAMHWVKTKVIDVETDIDEIVSTYKDNPTLPQQYVDLLEETQHQDINKWKIYGLGQWGSLDNIIYSNWKEVDKYPTPERTIYGCDFGFNSPTALVEIGVREEGLYLKELLYRSGLTNSDLIEWCKKELPPNALVYCDSAEPARIQEMRQAGISARKSDKSVKDGIDFVRRQKLHITSDSVNIVKEIQSYTYKQDKNEQVLEEPVKFNDHTMDAIRYAVYTHMGKRPEYTIITG